MMQIRRFDDAADFFAHVEAFLVEHEAEHCLLLGLGRALALQSYPVRATPLLATVEDDGAVVGVALRTPPRSLLVSLMSDVAIDTLAANLSHEMPDLPGVEGPKAASQHFAEEWQLLTGRRIQSIMSLRLYQLDTVQPVSGVPGTFRRATEADRPLLARWLDDFHREALPEEPQTPESIERALDNYLAFKVSGMHVWEDGQVVSISGRTGQTPNGIRIGPVYTPPELRGKGYASTCVAALSQLSLDEGRRFCFLFTDLANPTSNHIYMNIGYQPVSDYIHNRFAIETP